MPSPLEYLLLLTVTGTDPGLDLNRIAPAAGDAATPPAIVMEENGTITMKTILMEPSGTVMSPRLEAPVRITPDLVPLFKINHPVILTLDETGATQTAKVARIVSVTDSSGQTIQAILELDRTTDALQPGMTATGQMTLIP
jgi:hypothetical protein